MDKKKSIDLIKLEVLGCLNDKDKESLRILKDEGGEVPWKEWGEYQNLAAMIPNSLELKHPANELKDKTAMKLYSIRDEIKSKIDAKKVAEMPEEPVELVTETVEEIEMQEESSESISAEEIEIEEKEFAEVGEEFGLDAEAALGKKEPARFSSKYKEKSETDNYLKQPDEVVTREPVKPVVEKELIEKITREFIKSYLDRELVPLKESVNKNKILNFILFAVVVILIVVTYFLK
jgi:hypothetical protein